MTQSNPHPSHKRTANETGKTKWSLRKINGNAKRILAKEQDVSALSGRTLDGIAGKEEQPFANPLLESTRFDTEPRKRTPGPAPRFVRPMKATAVSGLPAGDEWIYEVKWDGYRVLASKQIEQVRLLSLKDKNLTNDFPAVADAVTWLKFKINKSQEFVIGGYKPDAASFQSILVGYYEATRLLFAGKVRQGFNPYLRAKLFRSMEPCLTSKCPFANLPTSRTSHFGEGITTEEMKELCWLKPKLVAQISFTEWTNYGLLRHATFEGTREDKEPRAVVRELGAA
jgi:ATP-dependent DNA ligase